MSNTEQDVVQILKDYNVKLQGEVSEQTLKEVGKGMTVEILEPNEDLDLYEQAVLAGRNDDADDIEILCLKSTISTDDEETLEKIEKECAANGCNLCLSETSNDIIEWPKHYNMGKIQPIDVIEDWKLDFRLANAVKYIARAGKKDPAKTKQDLEKALWYIRRFIEKEL